MKGMVGRGGPGVKDQRVRMCSNEDGVWMVVWLVFMVNDGDSSSAVIRVWFVQVMISNGGGLV